MAACWKESWNVDPLPLSVPLTLAEPPPDDDDSRRRYLLSRSKAHIRYSFSGRNESSLGRPVSL
jgi:hypothetical protein